MTPYSAEKRCLTKKPGIFFVYKIHSKTLPYKYHVSLIQKTGGGIFHQHEVGIID